MFVCDTCATNAATRIPQYSHTLDRTGIQVVRREAYLTFARAGEGAKQLESARWKITDVGRVIAELYSQATTLVVSYETSNALHTSSRKLRIPRGGKICVLLELYMTPHCGLARRRSVVRKQTIKQISKKLCPYFISYAGACAIVCREGQQGQ